MAPKGETAKGGASRDPEQKFTPRVQVMDAILISIGILLTVVGIVSLLTLLEARNSTTALRDRYEGCVDATTDLVLSCDDLSAYSRLFVLTGDVDYFNKYYNEYHYVKHRERAVEKLKRAEVGAKATQLLIDAYRTSGGLIETELHAMALVAQAVELQPMPDALSAIELTAEERALDTQTARITGEEMLLNPNYDSLRFQISDEVEACVTALEAEMRTERTKTVAIEERQQTTLWVVLILLLLLLAVASIANLRLVLKPLRNIEDCIQKDVPFEVTGSREIRNVAIAYNRLYEQNRRRTLLLEHMAQSDPLTGLLNRGAFDQLMSGPTTRLVLLAVDVDLFKEINDQYGHEVGDQVLRKVGRELEDTFDGDDYPCRIGGDEFAVIVAEPSHSDRPEIVERLETMVDHLRNSKDGIPEVTLSIGIAFGWNLPDETSLYHAADKALYEAKRSGRDQYVFFEDGDMEA